MSTKRPPPSQSSLVEFDDGPTQIGQSWFPSGPSLPRSLPSARSVQDVSASGAHGSHAGTNAQGDDAGSFPASSTNVQPSVEAAAEPNRVGHSTFAAAKGLIVGLSLAGVLGVGAFAYKQLTSHLAAASQPASAVTLDGTVEPARQASLQVRGGGHVKELDAALGKVVHEGDVIAVIDGPGASTLKAPFDGVVTAVYTNEGAQLAAGAGVPIADLADTSRVRVRLALLPNEEANVRAGDPVTVWSDSNPTHTLRATIARVIPSLNARSASAELELDHAGLTPLDKIHAQVR